jgi:hypothetical protein
VPFQQPVSSFAPMSAIPDVYNRISSTDNLSAALVPNPFPSSYIFLDGREHRLTPSLQTPSTTVDTSMSDPSNNLGLLTDQLGEPVALVEPVTPVVGTVQSDTGSVAAINHISCDNPTHEPKTISGGTFIGGNVNYIHATVIPPSKICISIVLLHFYLGSPDISISQAAQQANNCPPPSRIFQGRQTIRDEMNDFFTQEIQKQLIYLLYGLGGAGKTQIALKFISGSSW